MGNHGRALIEDSSITGNNAGLNLEGNYGSINNAGGGLYAFLSDNDDPDTSRLTITGTTVGNNTAGAHGGGITICTKRSGSVVSGADVKITNSTISGNQAGYTTMSPPYEAGTGGGIHIAILNAQYQAIDVDIHNSTIHDNTANLGGGVYSFPSTSSTSVTDVSLKNTIISGNNDHDDDANNFWGSINASGSQSNLIGAATGPTNNLFLGHSPFPHTQLSFSQLGANNRNNASNDPLLFPLADNGGPTMTHELMPLSDAIDHGNNTLATDAATGAVLDFDQRGIGSPRISNGTVDIGAIERETGAPRIQSVTIGSVVTDGQPDYPVPGGSGEQIRTVKLGRPNKIMVEFSEHVTATMDDLKIEGLRTTNIYNVTSAAIDINNVVTWTFDSLDVNSNNVSDQLLFTISEKVVDDAGNALDGEWDNPTSLGDTTSDQFPSGDGIKFGDFEFVVTFFPGDGYDGPNNVVDGQDFIAWNSNKFTVNNNWDDGDWDNSGTVDAQDFILWNANKFKDWTGPYLRVVDREKLRREIDRLVDVFDIVLNGGVNPDASQATWVAFADAVEAVMRDFGEI